MKKNKFIFVLIATVFGAIICFVGYKLIKPTFFIIGFLVAFLALMYVCFTMFVKDDTSNTVRWLMFGLSLLVGLVFGFIAYLMEKIGFFLGGCALAFGATQLIYTSVLARFPINSPLLVFGLIWAVLGIAIGCFLQKFKDYVMMLATSLFGSFLIVRPIFGVFGNLPNEFEIAKSIKLGTLHAYPGIFYAYLSVWLIVAILGLYYQMSKKKAEEAERKGVPDYVEM
jgi:hypothetical protein